MLKVGIVCDECDLLCNNTYLDGDSRNWCCDCRGLDESQYCDECIKESNDEQ